MQSLVTWCGGLSVRVSPPDSYIVILTSTVMGLRVGLWEVMGAMPYGSPEGALQFSSRPARMAGRHSQSTRRARGSHRALTLLPSSRERQRRWWAASRWDFVAAAWPDQGSWFSGVYELLHCQTIVFALVTNKHFMRLHSTNVFIQLFKMYVFLVGGSLLYDNRWFLPHVNVDHPWVDAHPLLRSLWPARFSRSTRAALAVTERVPRLSVSRVVTCALLSVRPTLSFPPPPHPQVWSLCLHLHCGPADTFITFILDSR